MINAIYKQPRQLRNRSVIEEQLAAAVAFITNVRERIDAYVKFGHEIRTYLEEQKRLHPRHAEFLDELLSVAGRLDQFYAENRARIRTPAYRAANRRRISPRPVELYRGGCLPKCAAQMGVFTSMGGAQDGLVASCRMIVKTLRQRSGIAMTVHPELKEIAAEVRVRTQAILRNPTPYEAPRH